LGELYRLVGTGARQGGRWAEGGLKILAAQEASALVARIREEGKAKALNAPAKGRDGDVLLSRCLLQGDEVGVHVDLTS
jgi:hypothetical protein